MTMGVKIVPKKLVEYNFLSMDFIKAHNVLCHQDKSRTKATALKLGWKIKDDSICEDCLLGKIREKNMNKKEQKIETDRKRYGCSIHKRMPTAPPVPHTVRPRANDRVTYRINQ